MTTLNMSVSLSGPLFKDGITGDVQRLLGGIIQEAMETAQNRLDEVLRPRPAGVFLSVAEAQRGKASTGHYRRSLHAERRDLRAIIDDSGLPYGSWLEGVSSRNANTRFKGYRSFQRTTDWMRGEIEGIARAHVRAWTGKA